MPMRRPGFLTVFFSLLLVVFTAAVVMRVRAYREASTKAPPSDSAELQSSSEVTATSNTWTIAPADSTMTIAPSAQGATASARDRRDEQYRELLTRPLPSSQGAAQGRSAPSAREAQTSGPASTAQRAAAPPQPKPSMLSRIVNAITGNTPAPAPQVLNPRPPAAADRREGEAANDRDPSSDTSPPQLHGIEFTPPLVHDGESTTLIVTAMDDLSGIRTIAGNVMGPSGALLGFVLAREGDPNRYVGRVNVPKNAADGVWRVNYLHLTDNAGNGKQFGANQGLPPSAAFRVASSGSDSTPPKLKAVWLDRPAMKVGERNVLFVQAEDDKSAINLVTGVFVSPQKFARFGFGCKQAGNVWECEVGPPGGAECGDWQLEQLSIQDSASNNALLRVDNPMIGAVRLNILTDQCDSRPPAVQSVAVEPQQTARPGNINVVVMATDDGSGVASISGYFGYTGAVEPGARPPQLTFFCRPGSDPQTFVGMVPITNDTPRGVWRLNSVQVLDKANNLKMYTGGDPIVSGVTFRVE